MAIVNVTVMKTSVHVMHEFQCIHCNSNKSVFIFLSYPMGSDVCGVTKYNKNASFNHSILEAKAIRRGSVAWDRGWWSACGIFTPWTVQCQCVVWFLEVSLTNMQGSEVYEPYKTEIPNPNRKANTRYVGWLAMEWPACLAASPL